MQRCRWVLSGNWVCPDYFKHWELLLSKFSIHGALSCSTQCTQCPGDFTAAVSTPEHSIYCSAVTTQRHYGLNQPPNKQLSCNHWQHPSTPPAGLHQTLLLWITGFAHLRCTPLTRCQGTIKGCRQAQGCLWNSQGKEEFICTLKLPLFLLSPTPTQVFALPARER